MPANLSEDDKQYLQFKQGLANAMPSIVKTQGQIVRNFGMLPPAYWTEAQASTPGPMKGGAPIYLGKQFTHGVMW
jgi:hypothetical protein